MTEMSRKTLYTVNPRGFCAGVERAIEVVDRLLHQQGTPLYVRKEIVHNKAVVEDFRSRGVIFVNDLDEVPDGKTVVFSAHGVSPVVREEAKRRQLYSVDATCPLVTKVHNEVIHHVNQDHAMVLIGHAGHDEVLGTMGEAPGNISLVTNVEDVAKLEIPPGKSVAYATQTTLSVDETRGIVLALRERFQNLIEPEKSDICYATQNRQDAVKTLVEKGIQHLLVVGSETSSNSRRLCEVALNLNVPATLIDGPEDLNASVLRGLTTLGLTAGASAPEHLVQAVVNELTQASWVAEEIVTLEENIRFKLPSNLMGK
jgi:4-hydroxy-3-methylbut-2-en-1-yl diphosphate reductase